MPLFVTLADGQRLGDALRQKILQQCASRHRHSTYPTP